MSLNNLSKKLRQNTVPLLLIGGATVALGSIAYLATITRTPSTVVYMDDFEAQAVDWLYTGTVPGDVRRTSMFPYVFSGTGGLAIDLSVSGLGIAYRFFGAPQGGFHKFGLEFWFRTINIDPNVTTLYLDPTGYDGTRYFEAEARYNLPTKTWQVVPNTGQWTDVAHQEFYAGDQSVWNHFKMVWDWGTMRFVSIEANSQLTRINLPVTIGPGIPGFSAFPPSFQIKIGANTIGPGALYIDDLVLTVEG